jgi:hypothetical protein
MPELKIEDIKVSKIVENFRNGTWAIPEFQRGYVWKADKVAKLIDSLYRNFPVSAILIWETDTDVHTRNRDSVRRQAVWVVDGQQRITTLWKIMEEENDINIVFNPRGKDEKTKYEGVFQRENAATKKTTDWVSVNEIFGDGFYRILESEKTEKYRQRLEQVRKILDYEIPVIKMSGHSFQEASEAFARINTSGVKLHRADIYSSQIAASHKNFIAGKFTPFIQDLHKNKEFKGINQMHLFKICEFIADCKNKSLYTLGTKEIKEAWEKTEKATTSVIKFLDEQFGVKKMDILRSGALLVVPIVLFASLPNNELDKDGLAGWLALASIHHHYSGATETMLDKDLAACGHRDAIRSLLKNVKEKRRVSTLLVTATNFGGQLNDFGALFAAYVACRHRGCIGLFTGAKLESYYDVDQHHIFPRSRFAIEAGEREISRRDSDAIANIAFIKEDANRKLGDEPPSVYLEGSESERLESQCIPLDKRLWKMENAAEFWEARKELLAEAFNEFVREKLPKHRL